MECVSLEELALSHNQIELLPIELVHSCPTLERVFLDHNPLSMLPREFEKFMGADSMTELRKVFSESLFDSPPIASQDSKVSEVQPLASPTHEK